MNPYTPLGGGDRTLPPFQPPDFADDMAAREEDFGLTLNDSYYTPPLERLQEGNQPVIVAPASGGPFLYQPPPQNDPHTILGPSVGGSGSSPQASSDSSQQLHNGRLDYFQSFVWDDPYTKSFLEEFELPQVVHNPQAVDPGFAVGHQQVPAVASQRQLSVNSALLTQPFTGETVSVEDGFNRQRSPALLAQPQLQFSDPNFWVGTDFQSSNEFGGVQRLTVDSGFHRVTSGNSFPAQPMSFTATAQAVQHPAVDATSSHQVPLSKQCEVRKTTTTTAHPKASKSPTGMADSAQAAVSPPATKSKGEKEKKKFVRRGKSKFPEIQAVMNKLQEAADKLNGRNDIEPAAYPHPPVSNGLYFTSAKEAAAINKITYWEPPANDDTIPVTQAEIEAWVRKLLNAIKNNEGCLRTNKDKDSSAFISRWAEGASYFSARALEAAAWKLAATGLEVHLQGWLDAIPEPKLRRDIYYSMCLTFEERMNLVVKVLEISKPTCEDLLKGNRYHEIVGCPQVVFERVYGNNQSNDHKSKILSTHRAEKVGAQKRKRQADGTEASGTAELDDRKKKQKRTAGPAPAGNDGNVGVAGDVASSAAGAADFTGSDFDAPHELDVDDKGHFGVFGVPTARPLVDPSTVPGPSIKVPTADPPFSKKVPKSTGSKRTIGDVENDSDASDASTKKTKTGSRAKAPVKGKGRTTAAFTAADKATASRSSSGSVRPSTRRKTPPVSLPQPDSSDASEATPPG